MKRTREKSLVIVYFLIYLAAALTIALHQPLNDTYPYLSNPPDEHSRYRVPLYICEHGTLPTGFEEELFSGDCRWTYGFYTLLPYMVQGYTMRFVSLFTDSPLALLYTARMVNVVIGFLMAYVVLLLGRKLFGTDNPARWVFCFLVTFLPQSLFMHTYVNPDSMCMFSTALMIYGLICGYEDDFSRKSCALLTCGIVLCALSYYNAYGYILGCIVLFGFYFLKTADGRRTFAWKPFLKKGILISVVVLLCIGWHFIRNYILYDGDFIGLTTKENFIKSFGIARDTYQSRGISLWQMFRETDYFTVLLNSFIAFYGSMSIQTRRVIYRAYKLLFAVGILGAVLCRDKREEKPLSDRRWLRILFHIVMVCCMLMPLLLTVRYAYTVDFQAQGRYVMPGLLPFMYYVTRGLEKWWERFRVPSRGVRALCVLTAAGAAAALLITVFDCALPIYLQTSVL